MPLGHLEDLRVFSGTAHPGLAHAICDHLGSELGKVQVFKFSNDNTFVQYQENIRGRDVFLVQSFSRPVNDRIMELLIMIDAAKRASAQRITAVIPYYAYGRTDKKDQPRVPITARLLADLLQVAGADRVLTLDLHAGQIQGFFNVPVDELTALPLFARYLRSKRLPDPVLVAADIGIAKKARNFAESLGVPLAIVEKRRKGNDGKSESLNVIGDVEGKTAIAFDDEVDTAGSLVNALHAIQEAGAREVYACCSHGVFSGPAVERINSSFFKEMAVTDSLPPPEGMRKLHVLSVAPLLGEAIRRIHAGESVGGMFETFDQVESKSGSGSF
ncbi:MAG: ribose-phosphate pyrophosphokinase [Dehalococcoidia bacterium]|nr:ribose-phosphate pyrophosphokinase [Dehalococcoidia bacterium]